MSDTQQFIVYRDNKAIKLSSPYSNFKLFTKEVESILGDGYSAIFQVQTDLKISVYSRVRFIFEEATKDNIVDVDVLGKIIYAHQEVLNQFIRIEDPDELKAVVMTHPQAEDPSIGVFEDVYIIFPFLKSQYNDLINGFVPALKLFMRETKFDEQMEVIPINHIDTMFDVGFYNSKLWPLPGSHINGKQLTISYVFERITNKDVQERNITAYTPETYFANYTIPSKQEYGVYTSNFFTNLYGFTVEKKNKSRHEIKREVDAARIQNQQQEIARTPVELATLFVNMLSPERYANAKTRDSIGQVLYNISKGDDTGFDLWAVSIRQKLSALNDKLLTIEELAKSYNLTVQQMEAVRRSAKEPQATLKMSEDELEEFVEEIVINSERLWKYFQYTATTMGTLKYWAKEDNFEHYSAFLAKDIMTLARKCLDPNAGHTDMARLCYAKYSDRFVCANIEKQFWYAYDNHVWSEMDKASTLRVNLSDDISVLFQKVLTDIQYHYDKAKNASNGEEEDKLVEQMKACNKIIKDLKTVFYKDSVIRECSERFHDRDFMKKLDENKNIMGCANGVYELQTKLFRDGKPEDFITLRAGAKFNDEYSFDHPAVVATDYYINTVYTDPALRKYVKKMFGSLLEGGNMNKDFYNMVGEGDNSKSMVAKLLKMALGGYVSKIPVSLIMGKRGNADNANPHLADKKGIRVLVVEEPPKGESNVSVVKELTGGDDILARALFKMPIVFSPQWKVLVITNHLLEAEAAEKAYWNRQKVIEHDSFYSFEAPVSVEEQFKQRIFPRDIRFDQKLKDMVDPFFWLMTKWYEDFQREGLIPPERVVRATNIAKLRNDYYLQFIRAKLEKAGQNDGPITVEEMYKQYSEWFRVANPRKMIAGRQEFEDEMSKHGHLGQKPVDERWIGIRFKHDMGGVATIPLNTGGGAGGVVFANYSQQSVGSYPQQQAPAANHPYPHHSRQPVAVTAVASV